MYERIVNYVFEKSVILLVAVIAIAVITEVFGL
jgi:hypothetical protein